MSDGDKSQYEQLPGVGPLGRHMNHDPRNRGYRAAMMPRQVQVPRTQPWWARHVYDQQGSSCTAQAAAGLLASSPNRRLLPKTNLTAYDVEAERHQLYLDAQQVDPWEGGEYPGAVPTYQGSSGDSPLKIMRDRGQISEWRWCFGLADVQDFLRYKGPVSTGVLWYESMDHPATDGTITVSGSVRGGHQFVLLYDDVKDQRILALNSWSTQWGRKGRFWISYTDYDRLLHEDGEAVVVVA